MKKKPFVLLSIAMGLVSLAVLFILLPIVITNVVRPTATQPPPPTDTPPRPSPTRPAQNTPIVRPTSQPEVIGSDTPVPTEYRLPTSPPPAGAICPSIKPVARSPLLWGARISPDSQWVSYWSASQEMLSQPPSFELLEGNPHFLNLQTGQDCARPELAGKYNYDALDPAWSEDGQVSITTSEGTFAGLPCQAEPFQQISQQTAEDIKASALNSGFSPDHRYQVKTKSLSIKNEIEAYETRILAVPGGEVVQSLTWQMDTRTGSYVGFTGGEWLTNRQFLIYRTIDRGPVILDMEKGAIQVMTDLLGIQDFESPLQAGGYSPIAWPQQSQAGDPYHLLVLWSIEDALYSEGTVIYLYHSESGLVEVLPFTWSWRGGFSPDGQWLMMDTHPNVNGYEGFEVWVRQVEDIDGMWLLLAGPGTVSYDGLWNAGFTEMVINKDDLLTWQPFPNPNGERLGCWQTSGYWTMPEAFSLDSCVVVATGNKPNTGYYGLFILNRCSNSIQVTPEIPAAQDFTILADAQAASRFTLLSPTFVPEGLFLDKVIVYDYMSGSQTVQIVYGEGEIVKVPDANPRLIFINMTAGGQPVTMDSLTSSNKEVAWDILPVTVRGQTGYTYWQPSVAAGNSAWLVWNEGDLVITLILYGDWPQPTESYPHELDELLLKIAESLK